MKMQQPMRLLNMGEVARVLGVTRRAAWVRAEQPDFPSPYATTGGRGGPMRLWHPDDIAEYAAARPRRRTRSTSP